MRNIRRLPPLLLVVGVLGWLFPLAIVVLASVVYITGQSASTSRLWAIEPHLLLLGMACTVVATAYRTRVGRPAFGPFPLDSWWNQVRVIALLWAPPLGGVVLALVIPPTSRAFLVVFLSYLLEGGMVLGVGFALAFASGTASRP